MQVQVIKPQVSRDARLVMSSELWFGLHHIRPFRKTFPPPFIILWNRMELGKI